MTDNTNRDLVISYFTTVWIEGHWDRVYEFVAEGFINHGSFPGMPTETISDARRLVEQLHPVFPDLVYTLAKVVADGDLVARHWTADATHQGEFMGVPATGKRVHLQGMVFSRIQEGRIVEEWRIVDSAGLLEQLRV